MHDIKPIPLSTSSLIFIGAGTVFCPLYYWLFPWLIDIGWGFWSAFNLVTFVGFLPLWVIAAWMYQREGLAWRWHTLLKRLRITRMNKRAWLYTAAGLVISVGSYVGLLFTVRIVYEAFGGLPAWYMDPQTQMQGMYGLLAWRVLIVLNNVIGEEVLWRGIILPRQELTHGRYTWWIHGLQWTAYHLWKPWEFLMLLPGNLAYGWICTRTQSTTPGLVMHMGLNGLGVIATAVAVF